jgi:hypothetical protein
VTGGDDCVAAVERRLVEEVTLRQATRRAGRAASGLRAGGNVEADVGGQVDLNQRGAAARRKRSGVVAGAVAVLTDAEAEVQPVDLVAEVEQHVPEGEAVLAARDGDEHAVVGREHVELVDGPLDLLGAITGEALRAERGVVPAQFDHRRLPA